MNWDFLFKKPKASDPHDVREQGLKAQDLWDNPAFSRAVQKVRQGIHEKWASAPIGDADGQLKLRLMLKLLDDVEGNIRSEMNAGVHATKIIKDEEERRKRTADVKLFRR